MGTEIEKQQQQPEQLETWKSSYLNAWETAFRQFMFLMSEQYSIELTVKVNGHQVESPVMGMWRESLQSLTPLQMREGLKRYMKSERRNFKPTPGDIEENAKDIEPEDKPRKFKLPNCPDCKGTGFKVIESKSRLTGSNIRRAVDCSCVRIEYAGEVHVPKQKQLPPAPPTAEQLLEAAKQIGVDKVAKGFPAESKALSDGEYNKRQRMLKEQADRLKAAANDKDY